MLTGGKVYAELGCPRRQLQSFLIEIVQSKGTQVARLLGFVDGARLSGQGRSHAYLQVPVCSIENLKGEGKAVSLATVQHKLRSRLRGQFAVRDGIRIFKPQRPPFVQIVVIDRPDWCDDQGKQSQDECGRWNADYGLENPQ